MKKLLKIFVVMAFIIVMPIHAFAMDNSLPAEVETRGNTSATVSDSKGNRYTMSGTSVQYLKGGKVVTSFSTSYYYDGTASSVQGYIKNISVSGSITLAGGGIHNLGSKSNAFSGASGSVSLEKTGLMYSATSVTGTHTISTNKESKTIYSYQY